jgi:sugar lactone lactonase YvrE
MTVTDTKTNTFTVMNRSENDADTPKDSDVQFAYAPITAGGTDSVKVTVPIAAYLVVAAAEYSGIVPGNGSGSSSGAIAVSSTASMTSGTVAPTGYYNLVLGFFGDASGPNFTPTAGSGYTSIFAVKSSTKYTFLLEDLPSVAAGTYAPTGTAGSATAFWAGTSAAFPSQCTLYSSMVPTIASISPNGSPLAGGETVTIIGNFFDTAPTVKIGGNTCTGPVVSGITQITCTAPAGTSAGAADVVVTDANGHAGTLAAGYVYGTVGSESWIGGIASSFSWNTYSSSAPTNFAYYTGQLDDILVDTNKIMFGVTSGTGYLYVADWGYNESVGRVVQFNAATGAEVGWIGTIADKPTGDPLSLGCTTTAVNKPTPGWCTGGNAGGWESYNIVSDGILMEPTGLALDSTGSTLYVADQEYQNPRIQKFNASTGAFLGWIGYGYMSGGTGGCPTSGPTTGWCSGGTVSGIQNTSTEGGFETPVDVAIDPANTYLYVYDEGAARIEQFNASTGAYIGWLGALASTSSTPTCASTNSGCTPGTAGQFSGGFVNGGTPDFSTVSGGFAATTDSYWGNIYASSSYLYVSDVYGYRIERYNLPSGTFAGWIGWVGTSNGSNCTTTGVYSGKWCNAGGSAAAGTGALGTTWAGAFMVPQQITSDGTYLYVADTVADNVTRFNLDGSAPVWIGKAISSGNFNGGWGSAGTWSEGTGGIPDAYNGGLNNPTGVTLDTGNGLLFVTDSTNHRIARYNLSSGAFNKYLFNQPVAPTGWQTSGQPAEGVSDGMFSTSYNPYGSHGLALDSINGMLYATDFATSRIVKFNVSTGAPLGWVGASALSPTGGATGCVGLTSGQPAPGWCTGGSSAEYNNGDGTYQLPIGIALDPTDTYLYVANADGNSISRIKTSDGTPQGVIGYITAPGTGCGASIGATNGWCAGSGAGFGVKSSGAITDTQLNLPVGLATDASGNIYAASLEDNRVLKFNGAGVSQGWIGYGKTTGAGNGKCPASTGGLTTGWCLGGSTTAAASALAGGFNNPEWVAADANGSIWVSDSNNHRIEQFNASTGVYIGTFNPISGQSVFSMGLDGNSKTLITYENYNGPMAFTRYALSNYALLGEMGYLEQGSLAGGQQGCTSLMPGASFPSLWCLPSDLAQSSTQNWAANTSWAASPKSQIVVDPSNHYMYFEDNNNGRIVRIPINN